MPDLEINADKLVSRLLSLPDDDQVCILDSCGSTSLGSRYLIAGIHSIRAAETRGVKPSLEAFSDSITSGNLSIFTLSYDLGRKLSGIETRHASISEPDLFVAQYDTVIVHDYATGWTRVTGAHEDETIEKILAAEPRNTAVSVSGQVASNFTRDEYIEAIKVIKERIRSGDTYQTNLTHQLTANIDASMGPDIFATMRAKHPAPFAAYLTRKNSTVISASPERFFCVEAGGTIRTSPIKGTRQRGTDAAADARLKNELKASLKDNAENTMIVDLLRNDLGRVCEYGSVEVEKLCELESHPTYHNLVSTISGRLKRNATPAHVLRALFPCGSITGAPKISTMKVIDEIETAPRGLSMGAIGYAAPSKFGLPYAMDMSVAIRTMVIRNGVAKFNVGGGITIDSDPQNEWDETLTKAAALLSSLGNKSFLDGV